MQKRPGELEALKLKDLNQKSRSRWAMDGDDNSKFFHGIINKCKASNTIQGLMINDIWEKRPKKIKKRVFDFFRNKFKEDVESRPFLECSFNSKLNDTEAADLIRTFSPEEIKAAVFECGDDRAPGPDGFNIRFVKRFWSILEADFLDIFSEFFYSGTINRGCSSYFISLVPKVKDSGCLDDYRPINLVGLINKHNLQLVLFVMNKYFQEFVNGRNFQDLCQAGVKGLITTIDRFEPRRKLQLSTYVLFWIRHAIIQSMTLSSFFKVPFSLESIMMMAMRDGSLLLAGLHSMMCLIH